MPAPRGGLDAGGYCPAQAAEVVSSNIVGYQKVTLAANNYTLLAPMFTYVGGGEKAIPDIFEEDDFVSGESGGQADYIDIWEDGQYSRTYFFSSDAGDAWSSGDDGFDETTDELETGIGFWFFSRSDSDKTVTLAGEVSTSDVIVDISADNYTLLANPFAAPLPIKSIVAVEGEFTAGESGGQADYIDIWEDGQYSRTYFYSSDAGDAWSSGDDGFDETEETVLPGQGFWFFRRGSAIKVKLPVPYTL